MKNLQIHIEVSKALYLKNPESSDLGKSILTNSILLINELGFEAFTFKKLGEKMTSPESSIYRYFENKHMLLLYLTCWYWNWLEYKIAFATANIESASVKLERALNIITQRVMKDNNFTHINEILLNDIVISESIKAFYTKEVDDENEKGFFRVYIKLIDRISAMVLDINPSYKFPHMLISSVIEGVHQQRFFAKHFPVLIDDKKNEDVVSSFYNDLIFKTIQP